MYVLLHIGDISTPCCSGEVNLSSDYGAGMLLGQYLGLAGKSGWVRRTQSCFIFIIFIDLRPQTQSCRVLGIIYRLSTIPGAFRNHPQLVGGLEPWFFFPIQLGITMDFFPHSVGNIFIPIPTDFHSMIFQRGRRKTTNQSSIEPSIFDMIPPEDGTVNHYFSRMILLFYSFGVYYIYIYV